MALVKFASTCDVPACAARSSEYTEWPLCRDCGNHTCSAHQMANSQTEADVDSPITCLCFDCGHPENTVVGLPPAVN